MHKSIFSAYIRLVRPWQYIKNAFVLLPAMFGGVALTADLAWRIAIAFIAFCLVSSAVYCVNDVIDADSDARHPSKCRRPVAAGEISKPGAILCAAVLLIVALSISALAHARALVIIYLVYVVMNLAYTLLLKRVVLVDISVIAIGFILRLYAGSVASGCVLSGWLVIVTFMLSLFLALGKRRSDSADNSTDNNMAGNARTSLYSRKFADLAMAMTGAAVIAAYLVYAVIPDSTRIVTSQYFYLTTLPIAIGLLRYMQLCVDDNKGGNHSALIVKDSVLRGAIVVYLLMFLIFRLIG